MVTDIYVIDMLTGRKLTPLPVDTSSWAVTTNGDDATSCTLVADDPRTIEVNAWGMTPLARTGLLACVDNVPVTAGPIWKRNYSQSDRSITLTAGGLWSYWKRRILLPVAAREGKLVTDAGAPDPAYDTNLTGLSLGTIAKRWVQLVRAWPGGSIPMTFPVDEFGVHERFVSAVDLENLADLLSRLTEVEGGPDISFRPRWAADGLGIYWEMQTGTGTRPRLGNPDASLLRWTIGAGRSSAYELEVEENGTGMAEEVFGTGGRSGDTLLIARGYDAALNTSGSALLQAVDGSHSTVERQDTLQAYVDRGAALGKYPSSFWSMRVRTSEPAAPVLGDFWVGDMATITVDATDPVIPKGDYRRRIARIAGDEQSDDFAVTFAEELAR